MFKIVSFNLRYQYTGDGVCSFIFRAGNILEKINSEKPDVICFQEGTDENIGFLKRNLSGYHVMFTQREKDLSGEGLAFAYRPEKYHLLKLDFFWLSDTPEKPGSRFADQSICPRICQSLLFKRIADGKLFRVYNLHLDHESENATLLGIKCALNRVAEECEKLPLPFFLMGDFNSLPESLTVNYCKQFAAPKMVDLTSRIEYTYHEFKKKKDKIDYIFCDEATASLSHTATPWTDEINGICLSDHYPVCLEIDF